MEGVRKAVLIHDPIGLGATGGSATVEDKGLAKAQETFGLGEGVNMAVRPGGLPKALLGCTVGPSTTTLFSITGHKEVPLTFANVGHGRQVPGIVEVYVDDLDDVKAHLVTCYHVF